MSALLWTILGFIWGFGACAIFVAVIERRQP